MRRGSRADILRRTLAIAPDRRTTYMPNSDQGTTVMNGPTDSTTARPWKEILTAFLKLGATSYGGPAMMGIMQAELQGKRKWVSKERFVEGLAVANMVLSVRGLRARAPGPVFVQRAGVESELWWPADDRAGRPSGGRGAAEGAGATVGADGAVPA